MKGNGEEEKGLERRTNGGLTSYYRATQVTRSLTSQNKMKLTGAFRMFTVDLPKAKDLTQ